MNLSSRNEIDTGFRWTTLADLILMLIILLMLSSAFVIPLGLPLDLSSRVDEKKGVQTVTITLTVDLQYYLDDTKVSRGTLEGELKSRLGGTGGSVILNVDKSVPSEHLIELAEMATKLEAKVMVANKPVK